MAKKFEKVVLDTNVLLDRNIENIIDGFDSPTMVILPHVVLKELDTFKKGFDTKNELARAATRFLDKLRQGTKLEDGTYAYKEHVVFIDIPAEDLDLSKPDYRIIDTAKKHDALLISQDINERVVADAVGVEASNYAPEEVDVNRLYMGYSTYRPASEKEYMKLFSDRDLGIPMEQGTYFHNEFVVVEFEGQANALGVYNKYKERILPVNTMQRAWGINSRTVGEEVDEQNMLLHLMMDKDVQFVSAIGPSGCGKTLVTLAAALQQVVKSDKYKKIVVMRPLTAVGEDIGYLPGDKKDKLRSWMASTYDAMDVLLEDHDDLIKDYDTYEPTGFSVDDKVDALIEAGLLELEAMTYIRGRSLSNQILIVDDAQNLSRQQAATIITRAGEGTKVVFLGDLSEKQIDNYRLTPNSNGLAYVIDRFKGKDIVGHVTLQKVQRSALAQLGVDML
mgnify:CR=1 FL=1